MASNDTPTLLANASAGQLLDDAKWAEGMAALDIGTRIIVNGPDSPDRASLLRLAELARAVAEMERRQTDYVRRWGKGESFVVAVNRIGMLDFQLGASPEHQIENAKPTLCAALAATRHTQGEGT